MTCRRRTLAEGVQRVASRAILGLLLTTVLAASGCSPLGDGLDRTIRRVTDGYRFSFLRWEVDHLIRKGRLTPEGAALLEEAEDTTALVDEFLAMNRELIALRGHLQRLAAEGAAVADSRPFESELAALAPRQEILSDAVETILARQIRAALAEAGIHHPADRFIGLEIGFPPVWFEVTRPPHVLVVSPRDRIAKAREVLLIEGLDVETMVRMEAAVEALGYSALVVRIGGFGGLYPALVAESTSLPFLLEAGTEEWLHQYLAFTPLGFRYVLDLLHIARSYEVVTLNETVAGIVSEEVAGAVLAAHYPQYIPTDPPAPPDPPDPDAFSFPREMRSIRLHVDELLAAGRIEEAEAFMEERRRFLLTQGIFIRRLNQAYFAFHGTYAAEPTSVDPIGDQVTALRVSSPTLRAFLDRVVTITSRADLEVAVGATP